MLVEQLEALLTPQGAEALALASAQIDGDPLVAAAALRKAGVPAELATAALAQAEMRRKGVGKFGEAAASMFFTRAGLEQATRAVVAARRAERLRAAGVRSIADLGCGLGADARAFVAQNMIAYLVEADPLTARCAQLNVPEAHVTCGDAQDFDLSGVDAAFCDPARRAGGRRVFRPDDYSPPWDWVLGLADRVPRTALKLAPGIDPALLPEAAEWELVSVDGEVVESAAWCGPLARVPRRATVIRGGTVTELTGSGEALAPVGAPRAYLFEPDGAVVRSHLIAELAALVEGCLGDETIAYTWSHRPLRTPLARCFEVDEVLPFSLKRLRSALRARDVGRVELLKRGSALDLEQLRRDLRLAGSQSASVLLTRVSGAPVAVIAQPVTA